MTPRKKKDVDRRKKRLKSVNTNLRCKSEKKEAYNHHLGRAKGLLRCKKKKRKRENCAHTTNVADVL